MDMIKLLPLVLFVAAPCLAGADDTETAADVADPFGHSAHGEAFDTGPRQKPWKMEGIGHTHFQVTTSVPEVQTWYDQGSTLLHNFWWFEAERAFRWCVKLDPDCAMAWWGLARAASKRGSNNDRMVEFLRRAVDTMDGVTDHERRYIEAWARAFLPEWSEDPESSDFRGRRAFGRLAKDLELIILDYPDDVEAKALFALASLYSETRYGNEAVIREILVAEPEHVGAHHYRIHNWDGKDGAAAIESCAAYGRLAWDSGHANHMPGHIYSGIGMWHEGAIWMDSATRVEKRYMQRRMTLPYHNWNYAHNRNYLSFIQEQLGLPTLAIDGARQLLAAPHDPKYNPFEKGGIHRQGMQSLARTLIKFERWDEILEAGGDERESGPGAIPWSDQKSDKILRAYAEGLAYLARGDLREAVARHKTLSKLDGGRHRQRMVDELAGRIALFRGLTLEGLDLLARAAHGQIESYRHENDPPGYPYLLYTVLGEHQLDLSSPGLAALSFEKSLEVCPNDAFALSGLARARVALGESEAARDAYGRLMHVWSDAEPGLRWLEAAMALGLDAEPIDDGPHPQRSYRAQTLDQLGPEQWEPYAAPELDALDAESKRVTLAEYEGRNVLLVFFLGESCVHCVEQLEKLGKKASDFADRDVDLLAISSDTPEDHAESLKLGELPFRLLADPEHENARRFHAYDDFEEIELHATILIDGRCRIRWARAGGDPFTELDFLLDEIDRVNADADADVVGEPEVTASGS